VPNVGPVELVLLFILIVIAHLIGNAAERKGQSYWGFFLLGLLMLPLALVIVLLVPDRRANAVQTPTAAPDRLDQLQRLTQLRDAGALSEDEFQAEKTKILGVGTSR